MWAIGIVSFSFLWVLLLMTCMGLPVLSGATFANSGRTIRAAAPLQFQITSSSKDALGATAKTRTITAAGGLIKHWDTRRLGPTADGEHGEAGGDQASRAEQQEDEGDEEDEERDLAFVNQPQAEVHADQGMDRVEIPMPSLGRMATGAGMLHDDIMSPVMEQEEGPQKGTWSTREMRFNTLVLVAPA